MRNDFSKFKDARKVTFKKDYLNYYKKGEVHYIHTKVVEQLGLKDFGKVEEVDFDALHRKAKVQK